jgi:F-type H+-transporting ATPase subunit alpha
LDAATQQQLTRGARMVELLKQGQYVPVTVEMQIVHLLAGGTGICDDIEVTKVCDFIAALTSHFEANHGDLLTEIREVATFKKNDLKERTVAAITDFRSTWN